VAGSPLKRGRLDAVLDAVEPWDEDGRREKNEVMGGVDFGAAFLLLAVVFLAIATTTFLWWWMLTVDDRKTRRCSGAS
jgi:hypothetical protein